MIPKSIAAATLMLLAIGCGPPTDSLEQQLRGQLFQQDYLLASLADSRGPAAATRAAAATRGRTTN